MVQMVPLSTPFLCGFKYLVPESVHIFDKSLRLTVAQLSVAHKVPAQNKCAETTPTFFAWYQFYADS